MKERLSGALEQIQDRLFQPVERREMETRERITRDDTEIRRHTLTVWQRTGERLEPFSNEIRYSQETKTHRDIASGRLVSKDTYKIRLKNWRLDTAGSYLARSHPEWSEQDIVDALLRLDELRSSIEPDEWVDIEIGELFSP